MRKYVPWFLSASLAFSPLAWAEEPKPAATAEAPAVIDRDFKIAVQPEGFGEKVEFQARRLYDHAVFLTSDECAGRGAGSPEQEVARAYIEKQLKAFGFAEVKRLPFDFIGNVKLGEGNALSFRQVQSGAVQGEEDKRRVTALSKTYSVLDDFRPFPISSSGEGSGELVFAGYGISAPDKNYDDYAGLDVKGKVVVAFRGEPETADGKKIGQEKPDPHSPTVYDDLFYKASTARDKGAIALLIVEGKRGKNDMKPGMPPDMLRGGGRSQCGLPLIHVTSKTADEWFGLVKKDAESLQKAIDEKLTAQGFAIPASITFKADIVRARAIDENIAVVIPGTDPKLKDEIVVIGAHHDHLGRGNEFSLADKADMGKFHRGADDNASGTSSVIELAGALYKNRASLKRTTWIIFFGAEEMGTLGSIHLTKNPPPGLDMKNVSSMLNLDMVGRCKENKVMVYGVATGEGFEKLVEKANTDVKLAIKTTADGFGGSDQTPFVTAGVPVLFFFTGSHPDYHKPSDTADKLNVADQAKINALVLQCAAATINAPERPKFVKIEAPAMQRGMGNVRIGTIPDYSYEGKGMRLSGVRGGSAADKAGLKTGDTIIGLDGKNVENLHDYMNAMKQMKPGVESKALILRDGKEQTLNVIPEAR